MSVPSSYSGSSLAAYMHGELGRVASALGFTAPDSYTQAIVRTLLAYGVQEIAQATNIPRLLALASVEAWRIAVQQLAPQFNINTDGRGESRAGFYEHARDMLADAEAYATTVPDDGTGVDRAGAGRIIIRYRHDPYSW